MTILKALEVLFKKNSETKDILGLSREDAVNKMKDDILKALNEEENSALIEDLSMSYFSKYVNILYDHLMRTDIDITWE